MNKKVWISIAAVLLAAVAGWFLWPTAPEYGDSYSEQQRKLWNERRAILPWIWALADGIPDVDAEFLSRVLGKDKMWVKDEWKRRKECIKSIDNERIKIKWEEKLAYPVPSVIHEDWASLAAEQVPIQECLRRANGGDAEACLVMACHLGWGNREYSEELGWRGARDVGYWLDRAEKLNHQGARFLKEFLRMTLPESRKTITEISGSTIYCVRKACPNYEDLPGYEGFLNCMRNGDLVAYSLIVKMAWNLTLPDKERMLLLESLRRQVKSGDVRAMEKLSDLIFFVSQDTYRCNFDMIREMKDSFWGRTVGFLPFKAQGSLWNGLVRIGLLDVEDTETMKELREGMDCARKAARRGSLAGMNCCLWNGVICSDYYTREDWDEVFRYYHTLLERNYISFQPLRADLFRQDRSDLDLVTGFYDYKLLENAIKEIRGQQEYDGADLFKNINKRTDIGDADTVRRQLDEWIAVSGADAILSKLLADSSFWNVSPELARIYADKVQELADEGDPFGKLVLGYCHEHGLGVPRDLGKAWRYYLESRDTVGFFVKRFPDSYRDPDNGEEHCSTNIVEAPGLFLLSLGIHNKDFPGRDEKLMYALAQELEDSVSSSLPGNVSYLLGRVYEDGIGTPVDKEKALKFYEKGKNHIGCTDGVERLLQEETKGISKENNP